MTKGMPTCAPTFDAKTHASERPASLVRIHVPLMLALVLAAWAAPLPAATTTSPAAPVLSGCEYDYSPFCIVKEDKQADGFAVALLRASLKAMGRDVSFKTAEWAEIKQDLAEGRLQALPMVARSPEREDVFDFTFPYLTMHGTIVVREGEAGINGAADLKGKRVAVLAEDIAHEYLRRANLGAEIIALPSFAVAMRELSQGKHDAVVIQKLLALQIMKAEGLKNLRIVGPPLTGYTQTFCFAVRKGDKELLGLLNEGLSIVMADGTFRRLHSEWFASLESIGRTRSRIVVGGDSEYPPYEYLDHNGQPAGYNVDLTRAIAKQMGLSVDIRLARWNKVREGLARGEIDIVHGMFYSPERDHEFAFSPPHSVVQYIIATRKGSPPPADMAALAGKSIVVEAGDIMHDMARKQGYEEQLVLVDTQEHALRLLAEGKHDCALVAKVPALYWIQKNGWDNVQLSPQAVLSPEYCYATPEGKDSLLSEFAEGLAAVKRTGEYRAIQTRWLGPYEASHMDFWTIATYGLYGAVPIGVLLAGSLLWSQSLKKLVRRRTAELQAETELSRRTAEELLRSNHELEQFAYIASHDLQEPLRQVQAFAELLQSRHADKLEGKAAQYMQFVHDGASRMSDLVRGLLDYSRAGAREARERVSCEAALASALANLQASIAESSASVTHDALPTVTADPMQLTQLFQNLVGNGIKFRRPGVPPAIHVGCRRQGKHWLFSVKDNGIGIDAEHREKVFLIFQRLHTRDKYPGTGIGLAICKKIVEQHGGRIWIESQPGEGSSFCFTLPQGGTTQ